MLTTDENAIAQQAAQEWLHSHQTNDDELDKALAALLSKAFLAGYGQGHTAAQNPPTNDAKASYLPRLLTPSGIAEPNCFALVGSDASISIANPNGAPDQGLIEICITNKRVQVRLWQHRTANGLLIGTLNHHWEPAA